MFPRVKSTKNTDTNMMLFLAEEKSELPPCSTIPSCHGSDSPKASSRSEIHSSETQMQWNAAKCGKDGEDPR